MAKRRATAAEPLYDPKAPKKPTNLSVNSELLRIAKELGINLSQTLERSLEEKIKELRSAQWLDENKDAIDAYNAHVERDGVFSDGIRGF